jgi:hypothetical protein
MEVDKDLLRGHCFKGGCDWICNGAVAGVVCRDCESDRVLRGKTNRGFTST